MHLRSGEWEIEPVGCSTPIRSWVGGVGVVTALIATSTGISWGATVPQTDSETATAAACSARCLARRPATTYIAGRRFTKGSANVSPGGGGIDSDTWDFCADGTFQDQFTYHGGAFGPPAPGSAVAGTVNWTGSWRVTKVRKGTATVALQTSSFTNTTTDGRPGANLTPLGSVTIRAHSKANAYVGGAYYARQAGPC